MNQFGIFYILTTFYISNALAQANINNIEPENPRRELVCKIKEATMYIETWTGEAHLQVFNHGAVYLYKMLEKLSNLNYYAVDDDSDTDGTEFPIAECFSIVTEDCITIKWFGPTIKLILDANDNTFGLYQKFFPFEGFFRDFIGVNELYIDDKKFDGGAVIKVKQVEDDELSFVILQDDTPRIIFPDIYVQLSPRRAVDTEVLLSVEIEQEESIIIKLNFDTPINADEFYSFLTSLDSVQLEYFPVF